MSDNTGIEWTDATWNPVTGCTEVSPGCDHCYAKTFAERFRGVPGHHFENGFDLTLRPERLIQPLAWQRPRRIFVNSMSDLFHERVPDEFIAKVFAVMAGAPRHTFQLLTKRHARMRALLSSPRFESMAVNFTRINEIRSRIDFGVEWRWPLPNVWGGVSVEDQRWAGIRIPALRATPLAVRFLSCEPLLGPIRLFGDAEQPGPADHVEGYSYRTDYGTGVEHDVSVEPGIDWVICGGESGPRARPMHPGWARSLRDQCVAAGVPFLFKQWGEWAPPTPTGYQTEHGPVHYFDDRTVVDRVGKKRAGRELDGRTWDEYPELVPA